MRSTLLASILCLTLGGLIMPSATHALTAQVKDHLGSPTIFVDGKPASPMMFYGWAGGARPTAKTIDTEWREYHVTFIAPEDNDGRAGVHFRIGGDGPGTVWVDDVKVYPGAKVDQPAENLIRQGDFEGSKAEIARDWNLFAADYADAECSWDVDPSTKVSGAQSLKAEVINAGTNPMHVHFHQMSYSVKKGQRYTYSLWMKADKPRTIDFMPLRIGPPWIIYGGESSVYQDQVRLAANAGVHMHSFGISMPWPKPGEEPDFSQTDLAIQTTLQADPDGLLLPRFGMAPPPWWLDEHPEAKMLFDDGKTEGWSMASEPWREEMQTHLRALVRHCEENFGDNMLGYHPCGQHTGEWFYYRSWEPRLGDFSPAMDLGFAKWTQAKYQTTDTLREAWADPGLAFDAIRVPAKEEQLSTDIGFFRDPQKDRKVIDYFDYKQIAMEEPLEMMARVIKDETRGAKLVCLFYGYIFDMHGIPMGPQTSGHLAMARLLQCPDVDIVCSPISYLDRELGGVGCFMSAVDSVHASGKLWLNEDDTRTYLTPEDSGFGRVDTREGTFQVHQRNFAQMWPRRLACWYMDLGGIGWLNGEDIWENIAPMQSFFQGNIDEPTRWAPEVALIVDEASASYTRCDRALHNPLVYRMRSQYFRMGAPFRIHLLSDLVAGKVPPAKAYFFANCFHLDDATRAAVRAQTAGKTAVWWYGGGFINQAASVDGMRQVTGLPLLESEPVKAMVAPEKQPPDALVAALCEGLDGDFGTETVLDPCWTLDASSASVVGHYAGGAPAIGAAQTPEGLRVYIGTLHCPAKLLRNVLKLSGVHLYNDSDEVILTDGQFLAISATSAGEKSVSLPRAAKVSDALTGEVLNDDASELTFDLDLGEVKMLWLQ